MEYQFHDLKAYKLHLFKTDKFKTITIMINFKRKVSKDEITIRSFIHPLLLLSCKKFPTIRLLSKEMESLYGPYVNGSENRIGNYFITSFNMTMINEKYTEENMNQKTIDIFKEVLFNPNIVDGGFESKSFNIVKNEIEARLKSIKDNPKYYSMARMLENLDSKSPISYRSGYLDDLKTIDEKAVYEYYKSMIRSDIVDVFVLGDIDFCDMKRIITEMVPVNTIKKDKGNVYIYHKSIRKRIKQVKETDNFKQAKLVIGCKIDKLDDFENKYVLPMYADILGGPSYSKLFRSVREENSLAYYIYSNYRRADNILTVSSGINKDSYDNALSLIKKEFDNMSKGNISEDELNRAKEDAISVIKSIEDKPLYLINSYASQLLYGLDDIEIRKQKLMGVTIDDVKNTSKKIKLDTVYLLQGGDNIEKDND